MSIKIFSDALENGKLKKVNYFEFKWISVKKKFNCQNFINYMCNQTEIFEGKKHPQTY